MFLLCLSVHIGGGGVPKIIPTIFPIIFLGGVQHFSKMFPNNFWGGGFRNNFPQFFSNIFFLGGEGRLNTTGVTSLPPPQKKNQRQKFSATKNLIKKFEKKMDKKIWTVITRWGRGRYASCGHLGGLSCLCMLPNIFSHRPPLLKHSQNFLISSQMAECY